MARADKRGYVKRGRSCLLGLRRAPSVLFAESRFLYLERVLQRIILASITLWLAVGCAPTIKNEIVTEALHQQGFTVSAEIKPYLTIMRTPEVSFRPLPQVGGWSLAGDMQEGAANQYSYLHEQGLDYGYYEALISVDYRQALLPFVGDTVQRTPEFWVEGPTDCFTFDGANPATQGWTLDGVFDGDLVDRKVSENLAPLAWLDGTNWPEAYKGSNPSDLRGSVRFKIPTGIPADPDLYESDEMPGGEPDQQAYWRVSYRSPDLSAMAEWQSLTKLALRFVSNAVGLHLQPVLRVRKSNGETSSYRAINAPGPNGTYPIDGAAQPAWQMIEADFQLPAEATVELLEVRVYGRPDMAVFFVGADSFLDGVCVGH